MATPAGPSTLQHLTRQRNSVNQTRRLLGLGEQGVPQPQKGPPAVVPAERPNVRQEAALPQPAPEVAPEPVSVSPGRAAMEQQVSAFLQNLQQTKLQQLFQSGTILPPPGSEAEKMDNVKRYYKLMFPWRMEE